MPAQLVPNEAIPVLASQITSPAMLRVLRQLQQSGFITNGQGVDEETAGILRQLSDVGLVDPGYDGPTDGKPFIWVSNHNGERVLKYFETTPFREEDLPFKLEVHPRARTALASLPERDRWAVLAAAEALRAHEPDSWPRDRVDRLGQDKPVYLLRASPD